MRPPKLIGDNDRESLRELLESTTTKSDFQRVQCLWLRAALDLDSSQIATAVCWNAGTVRRLQSQYFAQGAGALIGMGKGGRRRENLSVEDEKRLLKNFIKKVKGGRVLVVTEVKAAYEKAVGRPVPKSTVYRMLARHGWRKIAPRSRDRRGPQTGPRRQSPASDVPRRGSIRPDYAGTS